MAKYARTLGDRFRWYWKLASRWETFVARRTGTSGFAVARRAKVLVLETTGRRTGKRHRTPLMYLEQNGKVYIGGGAAGMTRVDWVANVRTNPNAIAWIKRKPRSVVVRELSGDEYAAARAQALAKFPGSAKYERSGRPIPYFRLDPPA